ncbi:Retrovirus-related Pol poly from transposon [Brachionus plicatilis]|uniref:Retrovirus-related Pol poly from transposon n=1 Tax=Brachionus plicatilis TaxID=10195 RepID=A0A3M7QDX5_BRAPC|nr:Retrovirus-related Pol poly from transposon [Brachionus plicatilis]
MSSLIPPPPQFDYEPDNTDNYGQKWTAWLRKFNTWLVSVELSEKLDAIKIAAILSVAGPRVEEVYETNKTAATKTYKDAINLLDNFFGPKKDTIFSTAIFRQIAQLKGEQIAQYIRRLRIAAAQCEFGDQTAIDSQISLQVIQGCKNPHVRKKALQEKLTLADIVKFAQSLEISEAQSRFVEDVVHLDGLATSIKVKQDAYLVQNQHQNSAQSGFRRQNYDNSSHSRPSSNRSRDANKQSVAITGKTSGQSQRGNEAPSGSVCSKCGQVHRVRCPAEGKTCSNCKKIGHFAKLFRSAKSFRSTTSHVRQVQPVSPRENEPAHRSRNDSSSEDSETSWAVNRLGPGQTPRTRIRVGSTELTMCADTGASTTIIDEASYLSFVSGSRREL